MVNGYPLNTNVQLSSITTSPLLHVSLFLIFHVFHPPSASPLNTSFPRSPLILLAFSFSSCHPLVLFLSQPATGSPSTLPLPSSSYPMLHLLPVIKLVFFSSKTCLYAIHFSNLPTQTHMQTSLTKAANYSQVSTPVLLKDQAD